MTDYLPLIARAVDGLEKSTGEARRALYERARNALVTQLRSVEPALAESDITKERLALEDAIRKVEGEAARKARAQFREQQLAAPPRTDWAAGTQGGIAASGAESPGRGAGRSARERILGARSPAPAREGIKGFREVVSEAHDLGAATAKAAQSARETRDSYGRDSYGGSAPLLHGSQAVEPVASAVHALQAELEREERTPVQDGSAYRGSRVRAFSFEDEEPATFEHPQPEYLEEEHHEVRPPRSYRGLAAFLVAVIVLLGGAATVAWQWPYLNGVYQRVVSLRPKQVAAPAPTAPAPPAKFSGRVPQEAAAPAPAPAGSPAAGAGAATSAPPAAPATQNAPAVAQRVVLYEEDSSDPQGKRYAGSVVWRTETVSPGPGLAPELAVRADVTIPERHMTVTWSLHRNTDQALPASHTIEVTFRLPSDFPGGSVANVPGILMKQSEQARGTPLAGLAVKVTNGFFLIGLSAVDTDMQRNVQLLKERPWFDIPIVYTNGGRAILALEKGAPGERAFNDAFAAWEKK
jgi:hypothetical protein